MDDCLDLLEITGDLETGQDPCGSIRKNLTNTNPTFEGEVYAVEDDAEWSPDGKQIVFTSHLSSDHILECPKPPCQTRDTRTSEIYVMNANGTGRTQLTFPHEVVIDGKTVTIPEEERAPSWSRSPDGSQDGSQIVFMCRPDRIEENTPRFFQICVMDANGANRRQLTQLTDPLAEERFHGSPVWSPDGTNITFDMSYDMVPMGRLQIWRMPPEVCTDPLDPLDCQTHLTEFKFGVTLFANYGAVRIPEQGQGQVAAGSTDRSAETVLAPAVDDGKADRGKQAEDTTANNKQAEDTTADHGKQAEDTTVDHGKQVEGTKDADTTVDHGKQAKDSTDKKDK